MGALLEGRLFLGPAVSTFIDTCPKIISARFSRDSTTVSSSRAVCRRQVIARRASFTEMMASFERFRFVAGSAAKRGAAAEAPATPAPKRATTLSRPLSSPPTARSATPSSSSSSSDSDASVAVRRHAFIAPAPARWRERYAPVCAACEDARVVPARSPRDSPAHARHRPHPSEHSWASGWSYSNPSNNFWRLLVKGAIVPEDWSAEDCPRLPGELGVGFTDAGCVPGSDAARFRQGHHARVASGPLREASWTPMPRVRVRLRRRRRRYRRFRPRPRGYCPRPRGRFGSGCGGGGAWVRPRRIVAFAGKRQYGQLFDAVPSSVRAGRQDSNSLPPGWPFCPESTEVWVLPSSRSRGDDEGGEGGAVRRVGKAPRQVAMAAGRRPRRGGSRGERVSRGDETNRRRGDDDASRCGG